VTFIHVFGMFQVSSNGGGVIDCPGIGARIALHQICFVIVCRFLALSCISREGEVDGRGGFKRPEVCACEKVPADRQNEVAWFGHESLNLCHIELHD